ncbi:MAG: HD-GYP domain-containing protein [Burkholderiales bacterium]
MELKEISVDDLTYGMYVSKLDRPWTETPFMFQGFVLKTEKQIDALKKLCKLVYVDPEKAERPDPTRVTAEDIAKIRGSTVYRETASVEAELPRAHKTYSNTTVVVKELSRAVEIGNSIDSTRSREAATQITESVVRNPDAMALLTRLQEKSGAALSRAVEISVTMTIFARFLQLPQEQMEVLGMLGLLQDVGKLKLPADLAARGPLNAAEIKLYQTHVNHSVEILSSTPGVHPDLPGLASLHHERFDGSGYPRGLRGIAIALVGLIAGIIDAYDSLIAPRPFGENLPPSTALNIIYKGRGTLFHAALVEQFIQCVGIFPVGSVVELNSGEVAIVIAQNMVRRMKPRIMIVKDAKGFVVKPYRMLDLMKDPKVSPDEVYKIQRTLESDTLQIDPREMFL